MFGSERGASTLPAVNSYVTVYAKVTLKDEESLMLPPIQCSVEGNVDSMVVHKIYYYKKPISPNDEFKTYLTYIYRNVRAYTVTQGLVSVAALCFTKVSD